MTEFYKGVYSSHIRGRSLETKVLKVTDFGYEVRLHLIYQKKWQVPTIFRNSAKTLGETSLLKN